MLNQYTVHKKGLLPMLCCLASAAMLQLPAAHADAAEGQALFGAEKCAACHQMTGPSDPLPVTQRGAIKGPPLWFAGSKFQPGWLAQWLQDPKPIRRVKYATLTKGSNDHVKLPAAEAASVAAYLEGLTDAEMATSVVPNKKLSRRKSMNATKLFTKKQVCFGCHEYPSRRGPIGGFAGPSLVWAGARLNADWIYAYIQDPVRYYPNGRMPVYGDLAFDPFTDAEFKSLAQLIKGF